jgi:hypothetical protein
LGALGWGQVAQTYNKLQQIYALAVLADCLNAFAVGAPLLPTFLIRSGFLPAAFCALIRAFFRAMLRYNPGGFMVTLSSSYDHPYGHPFFSCWQPSLPFSFSDGQPLTHKFLYPLA